MSSNTANIKKSVIVKFLDHIAEQEKHFNNLETEYRKMASTWLLAAVGACGYVLTADKIPFDPWIIIAGIGVIASIGIFVLYVMDLNVYHQLLDAYFVEGLRLEVEHYQWLRPIRVRIYKSQKDGGVTGRVMFYYFTSIALLIGISNFGIWQSKYLSSAFAVIFSVLSILCIWLLYTKMKKYAHNEEVINLINEYEEKTKDM